MQKNGCSLSKIMPLGKSGTNRTNIKLEMYETEGIQCGHEKGLGQKHTYTLKL